MEILTGIFIAFSFLLIVIFGRMVTTFFHELGHAIPSLLFTEDAVAIHIGSYGDDKNSFQINLGRLKAFFNFDLIQWNIGLCQHKTPKTYWQNMLIVLGGPVASLLVGIVLFLIMENITWNDNRISFFFGFFIISSIWDFLVNIIPSKHPIVMADGTMTYNDGSQLVGLIKASKYPMEYHEGVSFLYDKKYDDAINTFQQVLELKPNQKEIRLILIETLIQTKKHDEALDEMKILDKKKQLGVNEYNLLGWLFMEKKEYQNAISVLSKFLYKFYTDAYALNNRGYSFLQIGEYEKAIHDLNSALIHRPDFAFAYNNRGLAKVRLGQVDDGLVDIEKSKSLDETNAHVFLHLGYYFQKTNQIRKAHEHFQKAKDMEIDFHGIDYLIETTRENNF